MKSNKGFTFVENLMVIGVIMMIGVAFVIAGVYASNSSKKKDKEIARITQVVQAECGQNGVDAFSAKLEQQRRTIKVIKAAGKETLAVCRISKAAR